MGLLETIESPADIRRFESDQLVQLCAEIRSFLISSLSRTGGHLGSNLGVVELTVTLHRVFDSPSDVLLWDTGHQAYVHKILTGRRTAFSSLRQFAGLSGFPARKESEHDWIENSHASPALSYAHGLATALRGTRRYVVAVVGDGALTGGMAYEALSNIGYHRSPVIVILNDNGRSYAPTISRLTLTTSGPGMVPARGGSPTDAEPNCRPVDLAPARFFDSLGFRYIGPVDGHDMGALERAFYAAAQDGGPVVVHALTVKGRGYPPAETDVDKCLHDVATFDPAVGPKSARTTAPISYSDLFGQILLDVAKSDERVYVITAAMSGTVGLGPFARRYPERFLDVGIAEAHGVTVAAGMAMGGLRPVFVVISTFLSRAFDQLNLDVGLHGLPVVFGIDRAGITGPDGPSHHGVLDLVLLTKIPGMTVFAPSSADELKTMVVDALGAEGPCAIRYPKGVALPAPGGVVGTGLRGRKVRAGSDVCMVAAGRLLPAAQAAAERIEREGIASVSVWDPRVICPLDGAMLADAASHRLVVTIEDGLRVGGLGSLVTEGIHSLSLSGKVPPVITLGAPREYIPGGKPEQILSMLGLDEVGIAHATLVALSHQKTGLVRYVDPPGSLPASQGSQGSQGSQESQESAASLARPASPAGPLS